MSRNEATAIRYWEELHVNIIHLPLHLLCNARATKTIMKGLPTVTCGWVWSRALDSFSKGLYYTEDQWPHPHSLHYTDLYTQAIDGTSLQGIYKLSHIWVIVWTKVQTNNTKCVITWNFTQASGLKIVKTCTFQPSPHMSDSTNMYNPPIVW
jgi:hypothetical protein